MLTKRLAPEKRRRKRPRDGISRERLAAWRACIQGGGPVPLELQRWPDAHTTEGVRVENYSSGDLSQERPEEKPREPSSSGHYIYTRSSDPSPRKILVDYRFGSD
ncbi:MAG: hypothetical protein NTX24_02240 [Candidatus Pacearchaeota archaeon]|nr:hypothetical protein [Candidatus Pacearchaeota archaeon]